MKEKKSISTAILTLFLILALIVIAFMTCYIYTEKINANREIAILKENANEMQNTINNFQEKIKQLSYSNKIDNSVNTTNNNLSFTDEQIKTALSDYLELRGHRDCNGLLKILTIKGVLNYDSSKDIETIHPNDGTGGYYKTNIKYSDYRNAMLKYVSQTEFERNWNSYYLEDNDGNLINLSGGGSACIYSIKEIERINDTTYSAKGIPIVDGIKLSTEEHFIFVITSNNGNCVIDALN